MEGRRLSGVPRRPAEERAYGCLDSSSGMYHDDSQNYGGYARRYSTSNHIAYFEHATQTMWTQYGCRPFADLILVY